MDVRVDIESKFDKDIKKLSQKENEIISKRINYLINIIREGDNVSSHIRKLPNVIFPNGISTSLHVFRVGMNLRILLTFEEDPLFDEFVLTLFRAVRKSDLELVYKGLAQSLYQSFLHGEGN